MNYLKWMNSRIRKCTWVDMTFIKIGVIAFALMLAKLWMPILSLDWYWYLIIVLAASIKPATKIFGK
ncbi:MAG: hypothetical protein KKC75_01960 [Nanoarchaeota archaeon]|nr:hypothetical protein [Nanoarchaeota archaeon]MBU1005137.1 hypothetical protein [Nanoarchaeota archaeon]MBU1946014.1 hypothetical protein [Nanoarchaeota archaeon]